MSLNNCHFPEVLENSALFRKLFLLRKLFFSKRKSSHYSQFAEDVSITRLFPRNYKGLFVDVGCFHPIKHNNTYALYKRGWQGINVDIDQIKIDGFNLLRRRDTNYVGAVSNHNGEVEYYSAGFYSLINTLEKDFVTSDKDYRLKKTTAKRLDQFIADSPYRNREIDLLSVDVESHDLEVLKSLDFKRYRPKVVVCETQTDCLDDLNNTELFQFLDGRGYTLVNWCGLSLIFRMRDWSIDSFKSISDAA